MTWALWLAAPAGATVLAALWTWWRGRRARGPRTVTTPSSMRAHRDYLDALAAPARSADRATGRGTTPVPARGADEAPTTPG